MTTSDAATEEPQPEPEHVPAVHESEREVSVQRSVRYGRVLIGMTILGAIVAAVASLFFPVDAEAMYTMGQIFGFMLVMGAAIGLALGGLLALVLGLFARRRRGTGIAIQSDVH